ncbi:MAG TPA: hypothetical protein DIU00_01635 [Phycisphaerales bacterium]|nr:hypothetical protein [Phycisphaerales bacterium]
MNSDEQDKADRLPRVSYPSSKSTDISAPPEVEGYEILHVLGEGGMGIVYLAQQKHPVQRQVALKIVKPGMDSRRIISRFEAERQALAFLDHPNIAQVYDAGTAKDGHPYFSMEYVIGQPITEYCDKHRLSIEERLELFIQVCEGLQHAHQKGIIHRDIKPSNILVYKEGGKPIPKIIDFGVAKALTTQLTEQSFFTEQGQLLGTPEYMSPEQAEMTRQDIDIRSDIYSLGVLLYVLLAGVLPFERKMLERAGFAEILRTIREQAPPRPSTQLSGLGAEAIQVADSRRTQVGALAKRLHKELEWIPLKAMRKERARRYGSAAEFASDIQSYLRGEALIAGPESRIYRARKFIRRHRALVAGIFIVFIVLIAGLAGIAVFAFKAEQRRAEAEFQARVTKAVVDFLNYDLLMFADPRRARGRDITVREALDEASRRIEGRFKDDPLVEASIRFTLANTYRELGLYLQAERHLKRAFEIRRDILDLENKDTLGVMNNLGILYKSQGRYDEAEQMYGSCLEIGLKLFGEENQFTLNVMNNKALLYIDHNRNADAEKLLADTLRIKSRVLGPEHPDTLRTMTNLGVVRCNLGKYDKAEELLLNSIKIKRRRLGGEHPDTLIAMNALANLYRLQGWYNKAEPLYLKTLEIKKHVLGKEHPEVLISMDGLARLYAIQGRYDDAEKLHKKRLEISRRTLGEEHPDTLGSMNNLAILYVQQGFYVDAEPLLIKTVKISKLEIGEEHPDTLLFKESLAFLYKYCDRYQEAEQLLLEVYESRYRILGERHSKTLKTGHHLIALYAAWDKPQEIIKWQIRLHGDVAVRAASQSKFVIPQENLEIPEELQPCAANLKKIYTAIEKYHQDKGKMPMLLSDLVDDYLSSETLLCPNDTTDKEQYSYDPKLPCSYSWRFSSGRIDNEDTTSRKLYSDIIPILCCHHHGAGRVLNLSKGGQIYWSQLNEEKRKATGSTAMVKAIHGTDVDTNLVREAVARKLRKKPNELIAVDFIKVEQLDLSGSQISDLQSLEALTSLKMLHLCDTNVSNLEPLKALTGLRELRLSRTNITNIEPLAGLTNLQGLWIDGTQVSKIEPLKSLTRLKKLDLGYTKVSKLEPLQSLKNLRMLWLPVSEINSIDALSSLTKLQVLCLHDTRVSSVEPLTALTNLQVLDLWRTHVSDLKPLYSLAGLKSLDIRETNLSDEQIAQMQKSLPKLKIRR